MASHKTPKPYNWMSVVEKMRRRYSTFTLTREVQRQTADIWVSRTAWTIKRIVKLKKENWHSKSGLTSPHVSFWSKISGTPCVWKSYIWYFTSRLDKCPYLGTEVVKYKVRVWKWCESWTFLHSSTCVLVNCHSKTKLQLVRHEKSQKQWMKNRKL